MWAVFGPVSGTCISSLKLVTVTVNDEVDHMSALLKALLPLHACTMLLLFWVAINFL